MFSKDRVTGEEHLTIFSQFRVNRKLPKHFVEEVAKYNDVRSNFLVSANVSSGAGFSFSPVNSQDSTEPSDSLFNMGTGKENTSY
jgi:hypothetical protein